jgi:putative membrane protein
MFLSRAEADAIKALITTLEARTGVQVVTAVIGKADAYVELPWKAFALGAAVAGLGVVIADWLRPDWLTAYAAMLHALAILGAAAVSALAAIFVPAYARLFLRATRRDSEVRHYAESLFLRRELFKTQSRTGILLLVSVFERKVEILADVGLHGRVGEPDWRTVIARMTPHLAAGRPAEALQQGLERLEELLVAKGLHGAPAQKNELADRPIEERGAK